MTTDCRNAKLADFDREIALLERKVEALAQEEATVIDRRRRTEQALETMRRIRETEAKAAECAVSLALAEIMLASREGKWE